MAETEQRESLSEATDRFLSGKGAAPSKQKGSLAQATDEFLASQAAQAAEASANVERQAAATPPKPTPLKMETSTLGKIAAALPGNAAQLPPGSDEERAALAGAVARINPFEAAARAHAGAPIEGSPEIGQQFTRDVMTGSKNLPLPAFTEPKGISPLPGVRKSSVGELTDLTDEFLNRPDIPKTRAQAFFAGATSDTVNTINDMFLSPLGLSATALGLTETMTLAKAGRLGGDAVRLAQDYEAMQKAGASAAELAGVQSKMQGAIAQAAQAQKIAAVGKVTGQASGAAFGGQGVQTVAEGVQEKNPAKVIQGVAQILIGGAAGAGAIHGAEAEVKAGTARRVAKAAEEGAFSEPIAKRTTQVPQEVAGKPVEAPNAEVAPSNVVEKSASVTESGNVPRGTIEVVQPKEGQAAVEERAAPSTFRNPFSNRGLPGRGKAQTGEVQKTEPVRGFPATPTQTPVPGGVTPEQQVTAVPVLGTQVGANKLNAPTNVAVSPENAIQQKPEKEIEKPSKFTAEALGPTQSTLEKYKDSPERKALHQKLIDAKVSPVPAVPEGQQPTAVILGGGTGSGKTTAAQALLKESANYVNVDADWVKTQIPEYEGLKKSDPQKAAARVHDESRDLAQEMVNTAIDQRKNILYDASTTGSDRDVFLHRLKDAGYHVKLIFADVPTEEAIRRANQRALTSENPINRGRFVPEEVIRAKHRQAAKSFLALKGIPHETRLYDTSGPAPELVYHRIGNEPEKVYNLEKYERIRNKAEGREASAQPADSAGSQRLSAEVPKDVRIPADRARHELVERNAPATRAQVASEATPGQIVKYQGRKGTIRAVRGDKVGFQPHGSDTVQYLDSEAEVESVAKTETKAAPAGAVETIPTSGIHVDSARFQPRSKLNQERVVAIQENMERRGDFGAKEEPLDVWRDPADGKLHLMAGHHRLEAAKKAGLKEVYARIHEDLSEEQAVLKANRSNSQAAKLKPSESGRVYAGELSKGISAVQVAKAHGEKGPDTVQSIAAINDLPGDIKDAIDDGLLPLDSGVALARSAKDAGLSSENVEQLYHKLIKLREYTPQQIKDLVRAVAPVAEGAVQGGLFGAGELKRGVLDAVDEIVKLTEQQRKAARAFSVYKKQIESMLKKGEEVTASERSAMKSASKRVEAAKQRIEELQKELGRGFGESNTIFTRDMADAASRDFRGHMLEARTGLDPKMIKDLVDIGGFYLEAGVRDFASWSKRMLDRFRGQKLAPEIEPHLQEIYDKALEKGEKSKPGFAGNIRLSGISAPEDVLNVIKETAKRHAPEIEAQRRGTIPFSKTESTAKKMVHDGQITEKDLLRMKKGTALNDAELKAARSILTAVSQDVAKALQEFRDSDDRENMLRVVELIKKQRGIQATVSGAIAEAGRALNSMKIAAEALRQKSSREKALEAIGGEVTEDIVRRLAQIPDNDHVAMNRFVRDHTKFTTIEKLNSYWIANILSGWWTHARNTTSNVVWAAQQVALRPLRGIIDAPVSKILGTQRKYYAGESLPALVGLFEGLPEGFRKAWEVMKHGYDLNDAAKLERPGVYEFPGGAKNPWNIPGRALSAADKVWKIANLESELAAIATRRALRNGGLKGARQRFIDARRNPEVEDTEEAAKFARYATFTGAPDSFARLVLRIRDWQVPEDWKAIGGLRPFSFIVPFVNTPWNITKAAVEFTPAGAVKLLSKKVRSEPGAAADVIAKALLGAAVLSAFAMIAMNGHLTGPAPDNPGERDEFFRLGKKPYAVKIGDKWYPYLQWTGPLGIGIAAVAAWHTKYTTDRQIPTTEKVSNAASAVGRAILDQSFFQGLANLLDAIREGKRVSSNFFSGVASGFVPLSGLLKNTAGQIDPYYRDARGIYEQVARGIPFLSKTLPVKRDVFGRPAEYGIVGKVRTDKVDQELARIGLQPSPLLDKIRVSQIEFDLSPKGADVYREITGKVLYQTLDQLFSSEGYKRAPEFTQYKEVQKKVNLVREAGRDMMLARLRTNPEYRSDPFFKLRIPFARKTEAAAPEKRP